MRKMWLTLVAALMCTLQVSGGSISEEAALHKAQSFLSGRGKTAGLTGISLAPARTGVPAQNPTYYVFNLSDGNGYVVVSGDDVTEPILGYSDFGTIDLSHCPDGLQFMLDCYAAEMAWLEAHPEAVQAHASQAPMRDMEARVSISPLIQTRWNQGEPYNNNCPEISSNNVVIGRAVTGCVATSMAQVMYYHHHPVSACSALPGYTARNGLSAPAALPDTTFAWEYMTLTYGTSSSENAKNAVAKLMQYCGQALQMNYNVNSVGGSSAYNESITEALKTYFGYSPDIASLTRRHYSYSEWISLIYRELSESRPVILGGQSAGGGHSFVCDGYDTDDYFHINWGWGGQSDGYFRLSLLAPYEQGIGGSSTLDGFGFSQGAVVGIHPDTGREETYCLSLEGVSTEGNNVTIKLLSYMFGTADYDYALQLFNSDGTLRNTWQVGTASFTFNTTYTFSFSPLTLLEGTPDGNYTIRVVSRPNGETLWRECYDGRVQEVTAVLSNGELSLSCANQTPSGGSLVLNSITVTGNKKVGYEQEVKVSITNNGTADYRENLFLYVESKRVMGRQADLPAGQTVEVRFAYTPSVAGDNNLKILAGSTQVGNTEIVVIASSDADNSQTLTITPTILNLSDGALYGGGLKAIVHAVNPDTEHTFVSSLACSLREYSSRNDGVAEYINATAISKNVEIAPNGAVDLQFDYAGLTKGRFYRLRISYVQSYVENEETKTRRAEVIYPAVENAPYEMQGGYLMYGSDGSFTLHAAGESISFADNACVDLRAMDSFDGISGPSTNPNCLYLMSEGADVPAVLEDKNVIVGDYATSVSLTDGYDFFSPIEFTAGQIHYTRTFALAANGTSGWNTIFLPFSVSSIMCNDNVVDWFHSANDSGKNFWLRTFTADGAGMVCFDNASSFDAYTPYIIAVPDDRWGEAWQMTGKPVVFSGTNAKIKPMTTASLSGNNYNMLGTTVSTSASEVYTLNVDGSRFTYSEPSTDIEPFRAWFDIAEISSLTLPALVIGSGVPTILAETPDTPSLQDTAWYTIDGHRLENRPTQRGFYIHNHQKYFIP